MSRYFLSVTSVSEQIKFITRYVTFFPLFKHTTLSTLLIYTELSTMPSTKYLHLRGIRPDFINCTHDIISVKTIKQMVSITGKKENTHLVN